MKKTLKIRKISLEYIRLSIMYLFIIGCLFALNMGQTTIRVFGFWMLLLLALPVHVDELIVYMIAIEPFSVIFKFNGTTFMPFLAILLLVKLIIRKSKIRKKWLYIYFILLIISGCNSFVRYGSLVSVISFYIELACIILISYYDQLDRISIFKKSGLVFVISTVLICELSKQLTNAVHIVTNVSIYKIRSIGFSNEWDFGRHIVVAIAFIVMYIIEEKKHLVISTALIVYLLYNLIATALYSALIALVLVIVLIPFCVGETLRERLIYALVFLIISVILLLVIYRFVFQPMLMLRGQIGDNGRFDLWRAYLKDFSHNLTIMMLGVGGGCISEYAHSVGRFTTHNILIEKFFEFGIIGMTFLVYLFRDIYKNVEMDIHYNRALIPLYAFLGTSITQGVTGAELLFLLIIISFVSRQQAKKPIHIS